MQKILTEIEEMQAFLEITTSEKPEELVQRLSDLNVYLARSGKLLADMMEMQDKATALVFDEKKAYIAGLSTTLAKKFVESQTAEINGLVKWLDRINSTCSHQSANIRTQISFAKENLRLTKTGY